LRGKRSHLDERVQDNGGDENVLICLRPPLLDTLQDGCTSGDIGGVFGPDSLIINRERAKRKKDLIETTEGCLGNIGRFCERFEMRLKAVSEIY
jgi:hypothetical protein